MGVLEVAVELGKVRHLFSGAMQHIDWLATPLDHDHLAGLEFTDVGFHGSTSCLGLLRRVPRAQERHGNTDHAAGGHRGRSSG